MVPGPVSWPIQHHQYNQFIGMHPTSLISSLGEPGMCFIVLFCLVRQIEWKLLEQLFPFSLPHRSISGHQQRPYSLGRHSQRERETTSVVQPDGLLPTLLLRLRFRLVPLLLVAGRARRIHRHRRRRLLNSHSVSLRHN